MKHVVFVVGNYYPDYSAVGNCAEKVISLLKNDYHITVVSVKNRADLISNEAFNGFNIHRVESSYQKKLNNITTKNSFFAKSKLYKERLLNLIKFLFRRESIDPHLVKSYLSKLITLNKEREIDVLIPLVFPFESVMASIAFKDKVNSNCSLIPYLFDNFSNSASLHRFNINRNVKFARNRALESLMLEQSSKIFAMHPLRNHFESTITPSEQAKISYIEHPLLLERDFTKSHKVLNDITFTYTGGLFRGVRTANGCLTLLDKVSNSIPLNVRFYCFGNDLNAINRFSENKPEIFKNYGKVQRDIAEKAIDEADILISIGDVEGKQLSSKIFDYLSMGKPIIHFSYVENCVNSQLLKRYPLAFIVLQNVKNNYSESLAEDVSIFAKNVKGKAMKFSDVAKIYPEALPETTAKLFKEYINSNSMEKV